ncbi:hypothetical protein C8Q75DRAFT_802341 [Abortiporus biennis]|nr:hypothetical protein C8Q75DRAFT_802341 [Abortiporus biennis]
MERSATLRPRRPTRDLPPLPLPGRANTDSTINSPPSPDQLFLTPLASPHQSTSPLVDSPTSEVPPSNVLNGASFTHPQSSATETEHKSAEHDDSALTPLRAHYLKKQLVQLQFNAEMSALVNVPATNISTFSYLGPPFSPPPKDGPRLDLPFLRYMFRHYVLSFPFLAAAPKDFFPEKLQPFMASMLSRNLALDSVLDLNPDNSEEAARYKVQVKLQRQFAMLMTSGTKLVEEEDVVRLTQRDLNRLENLARRRAAKFAKLKDTFEINVVCVRTVIERGRVRNRAHEEFIIRTRRKGFPDIYVSRRYGDFRTLVEELRKAHPSEAVPPPPPKDRSFVNVSLTSPTSSSAPSSAGLTAHTSPSHSTTSLYAPSPSLHPSSHIVSPTNVNHPSHGSSRPYPSMPGSLDLDRTLSGSSYQSSSVHSPPSPTAYYSVPPSPSNPSPAPPGGVHYASRLSREKNRLTLRSYLHTLLSSSVLGSSPVLKSFLLSNPTRLTDAEHEDSRRREEADRLRDDGRKRFAQEIKDRVDGLRDAVKSVKGELLGKDGLTHVFATIKHTPEVKDLPDNYKAVVEWGRISVASTVFQFFVAADNASENFATLKRIHGMMPYFMLKAALKISNPMAMIRGVLDLFLAQPFGGRSLLQRMFTGSLMEEVRALEEDIEAVKAKVEDPVICEKVRLFVEAPKEIQYIYKADAVQENLHVLTVLLRSGEQPALSRPQLQRVMRAHHAHREYVKYTETLADSDDDEGPQNEDAWLYEDLTLLAKLYARLRDRNQLIALIFEGTTADLLKDIITIFYAPLAQVYRAASIADSLGDLQNFINDLIRTVEQTEELSQTDPAKTVQIFINLIKRHEQAFYGFVHKVHSKGEGLFDSLMRWIERFLTLMREGLGQPISLEFLLPHTGPDRREIMREVDEVARYHYKLKLAYEAKVRRRFGRSQGGQSEADAEDEAAAALVNNVVEDLSFGDLVKGDADDLAAEETDEEDELSSEEETSSSGDDEDDGSDSSEEDSEESEEGSSTEGEGLKKESPSRPSSGSRSTSSGSSMSANMNMSRSYTVAHSALSPNSRQKQSLELPVSPHAHQQQQPAVVRAARSMTFHSTKELPTVPPRSSTMKPLPPRPGLSKPETSLKKKAKKDGPKPPELKHIPQLLPLFVEVMRPLLRPTPPQ